MSTTGDGFAESLGALSIRTMGERSAPVGLDIQAALDDSPAKAYQRGYADATDDTKSDADLLDVVAAGITTWNVDQGAATFTATVPTATLAALVARVDL